MKELQKLFNRGNLTLEEIRHITETLVKEDYATISEFLWSVCLSKASDEPLVVSNFYNNNPDLLHRLKLLCGSHEKKKKTDMIEHYKKEIAWMQKYIDENEEKING